MAVALVLSIVHDGRCRIAQVRGNLEKDRNDRLAAQWLSQCVERLGAWQAMAAKTDLADAQLAVATALHKAPGGTTPGSEAASQSLEWAMQAADNLRELNEWCPAYPGAACRLADALQLAGDLSGACDVLKHYATHIDAYNMPANLLALVLCPMQPGETIDYVRRMLRDGEWMSGITGKVVAAFNAPEVADHWRQEVLAAITTVQEDPTSKWADTLAPETLRIEAAHFGANGDATSAARMASIAVRAYGRMADENSVYRRSAFAEADASLQLARFSFTANPSKLDEAFKWLRQAEELAVQSVPQRPVIDADPRSEFVGGKIIPARFPPELRPLWRFSAMIRLAMGGDHPWARQRIEWSLPENERTPQRIAQELGALSSELVGVFQRLDPGQRPKSFDALTTLAQQFGAKPAAPPSH